MPSASVTQRQVRAGLAAGQVGPDRQQSHSEEHSVFTVHTSTALTILEKKGLFYLFSWRHKVKSPVQSKRLVAFVATLSQFSKILTYVLRV